MSRAGLWVGLPDEVSSDGYSSGSDEGCCFFGSRTRALLRKVGVRDFDTSKNGIELLQMLKKQRGWGGKKFNKLRQEVSYAIAEDLKDKLISNGDGDDSDLEEGQTASAKLNYLNAVLQACGRNKQKSITQAKKQLRSVNINIFDFAAGKIVVHKTVAELMNYSVRKKICIDREIAKEFNLRALLKTM